MEYLIYLLVFLAGWFIGRWVLRFMIVADALNSMSPEELRRVFKKDIKSIPVLHTEQSNDSLFLYDTATNTFLCQGKSLDELVTNLKSVCNISTAQVTHDDKQIFILDGKIA